MRKISSILATILMASLLFAGVAQAETCTISNTGPGSTNECEVDSDIKCEVKNDTDIDVDNDTDQNAESGDADVDGNTTGGDATSGGASNSNTTDVGIEVTNGGCEEAAAAPNVPGGGQGAGGQGAGQVSGVSAVGGRGAGAPAQVAAPVGGVGAGSGGLTLSVLVASLASAALGAHRLRKLMNA